jgi:RNA polymerase sigma-70 factor (ECF subfamily)
VTISEVIGLYELVRPRIPIRGLLGYVLAGALHVRNDDSGADDYEELRAIDAARSGDTDAFDLLVCRYSRRVLSVVWNIVRDPTAAEDIAQDAFVRAWENLPRFRSGERFGPWIYRIATNLAIDAVRRRVRRGEQSIDEEAVADFAVRPDEFSGIAARIDDALESLPEMQRIVARLHLVEEFDHAEIAEMTGLSQGTVRSHLSYARRKLQEKLRDLYGGST